MADFVSTRSDRASQTYAEFMTWLQSERHDEIKALFAQALNILRQFEASGAIEVFYYTNLSAPPGLTVAVPTAMERFFVQASAV